MFQPYSNPVSPLGRPTSGSTPTSLYPPSFAQVLNYTRYGPTSSVKAVGEKQSYREEEEEAGLKEGAGRIRLQAGPGNNVVCTCYAQQASGCTLPV